MKVLRRISIVLILAIFMNAFSGLLYATSDLLLDNEENNVTHEVDIYGKTENEKEAPKNEEVNIYNQKEQLKVTNEIPKVSEELTANLEVDVNFDLPIKSQKEMKMNLNIKNSNGKEVNISFSDVIDQKELKLNLDGKNITAKVRRLNYQGIEITDLNSNEKTAYFGVSIYDLKLDTYTVTITNPGYKTAVAQNIELKDYSKRITISNTDGSFLLGDINSDGVIDNTDAMLVISNISAVSNEALAIYDLNMDKVIDIVDLSYVVENMGKTQKAPTVVNTNAIVSSTNVNATANNGTPIDISNLFNDKADVVKVPASTSSNISVANPAVLNLDFNNAVDTKQIRIVPNMLSIDNAPTTVKVEVTDVNGNVSIVDGVIKQSGQTANFTDEADPNTIIIDLGNQVAVKKIVIKITGTRNNQNLAEISKVEFLNNVYEKVPPPSLDIPTGLTVTPDSESLKLSWNHANNVTSYEVKWEISDGNSITESKEFQTSKNSFEIKDLDNYQSYKISVRSVNGDWKSKYSDAVDAMPLPNRLPPPPENVSITGEYITLKISWKKMKDTKSYNLFYRVKGSNDKYESVRNIEGTSYTLQDLKDNAEYEIYLTGNNHLGEGQKSAIYIAKTTGLEPPITPNYKLINTQNGVGEVTSHIKDVTYPRGKTSSGNKFDVVDNDYSTYWNLDDWDSGAFYSFQAPIITLDDKYKMDRIVLVAPNGYTGLYSNARINYYDEDGKVNTLSNVSINKATSTNGKTYYIIESDEPFTTDKLQVMIATYGSYRQIRITEIKLYNYDSLMDDVNALFADDLHITLKEDVTEQKIDELVNRANTKDEVSLEYNPDRDIALKSLDLARKILNDKYISEVITVNKNISNNRNGNLGFAMALNDYQPLGIVARAGDKIVVYVGTDSTILPQIVFTQYYAESGSWTQSIQLKKGENVIIVPTIGNMATERGGSVYVRYPSDTSNGGDIKIRVSGGEKIPTLDVTGLNEAQSKEKIKEYIIALKAHVANLPSYYANRPTVDENGIAIPNIYPYNEFTSPLNSTEIVTKNVILSVPATKALSGITTENIDAEVNKLYNSLGAFEEIMNLMYKEKGLTNNGEIVDRLPSSRINIRCMRMFDGAFMYAGGFHIGIGPGSVPGLMNGKMSTIVDGVLNTSGYFGWGISHEIGHQIDESNMLTGEVTNNIYSLFVQTADDRTKSRLEVENRYPSIYKKVTSQTTGMSSDVFTTLGMYWQLRLYYDDGATNTNTESFYAKLNRLYRRNTEQTPTQTSKDNLLLRLSCDVTGKDLTDFFVAWGVVPTQESLEYIKSKGYEKETKKIQYINDEARRYRINGGTAIEKNILTNANMIADQDTKEIKLTFNVSGEKEKVLGYEILRNGIPVAFVEPNEDGSDVTYLDELNSINNKVFTYEIVAYDKLLNTLQSYKFDAIKISNDGVIRTGRFAIVSNVKGDNDNSSQDDPDSTIPNANSSANLLIDRDPKSIFKGYNKVTSKDTGDAYVNINLNTTLPIAGLKYTAGVEDGKLVDGTITNYEVYVSNDNSNWTLAKRGKFNEITVDNNSQTIYFDKAGVTGGNQLWTYNVAYVKVVAKGAKVLSGAELELIAPPGDNIELSNSNIGIMENDYKYGLNDDDVIPKGAVVFKGEYRGNPAYNALLLVDDQQRTIEGTQVLFAKLPDNAPVQEIASGSWIFYMTPEEYKEIKGKVRANLYRTDDALTLDGQRFVSDTLPIALPDFEDLSSITLEQAK